MVIHAFAKGYKCNIVNIHLSLLVSFCPMLWFNSHLHWCEQNWEKHSLCSKKKLTMIYETGRKVLNTVILVWKTSMLVLINRVLYLGMDKVTWHCLGVGKWHLEYLCCYFCFLSWLVPLFGQQEFYLPLTLLHFLL